MQVNRFWSGGSLVIDVLSLLNSWILKNQGFQFF